MSDIFKLAFGWIECIPGMPTCKNCGYEYDPATYKGETCCDNPVLSFAEPTVIEHDLPQRP
jgi:hypothetical protein